MACAYGERAKDCAVLHWCGELGARAEADGWRAPCPAPGCPTTDTRLLKFSIRGQGIGWTSYCPHHDKDTLRPILRRRLKGCIGGRGPAPIDPAELTELALSGLPPQSLRLGLLEMAGMTTADALAKLGVGPTHKRRVIDPLRKLGRLPDSVSPRRSGD